jgi:glycine/D-amino acid oxidase-like deaminating enzyme
MDKADDLLIIGAVIVGLAIAYWLVGHKQKVGS